MTKKEIRQLYKEKRAAITDSEFEKLSDLLLIQFQSLALPIPDSIFSYLPFTKFNEIDLSLIEAYSAFKNPLCRFSYPIIDEKTHDMEAVTTENKLLLVENKYGIAEPIGGKAVLPEQIDMVFLPLLAFDIAGTRVGYGKGYYDRFLTRCRTDVIKLGFSFFESVELPIIKDELDVAMNYCVTPYKIYQF